MTCANTFLLLPTPPDNTRSVETKAPVGIVDAVAVLPICGVSNPSKHENELDDDEVEDEDIDDEEDDLKVTS